MLSLKSGQKIAIIDNKKDLYIYGHNNFDNNDDDPHIRVDEPFKLIDTDFYKENDIKDRSKFKKLYDDDLLDMYTKELVNQYIRNKEKTFYEIKKGSVFPIPQMDSERIYISAPSGSGKSTFIGQYLEQIRKQDKKRPIYIFSRVAEDEPLDRFKKTTRIPLEMKFWEKYKIKPEDFKKSVCIFDDIDTITDKALLSLVRSFRDDLLECGRHFDITTICTSHLISNYSKTRTMINEANAVVLFPKGAGQYSVKQFLEKNIGLSSGQIKQILNLPTRWLFIWKSYPRYIVYQKGVLIV